MNEFLFHVKYGLQHVLDWNAYDHVLFLIALTAPYTIKNWKRLLYLVSTFTIGHTISLFLTAFQMVHINANLVEFLIPITILLVAIINIYSVENKKKNKGLKGVLLSTLLFGLIHGLGFGREFKMLVGASENKLSTLIAFTIGIEMAQLLVVLFVLFFGFIMKNIIGFSKKDYILIVSSIVIGLVIPLIRANIL